MKIFLELVGDALIIAYGITFMFIFACIIAGGGVCRPYEPSVAIRWTEFIVGIIIILIGIKRLVDDVRKFK